MQDQLEILEQLQLYVEKYLKFIVAFIAVCSIGALLYGVVVYQKNSRAQAAYQAFAKLKKIGSAPVHDADNAQPHDHTCFNNDYEKWATLANEAQTQLEKHGSSKLGSHFAMIKAGALLRMDQQEDAKDCIDKHLAAMPTSPVKDLFAAQQALMMLDSTEDSVKEAGLAALTKIAHAANAASDFAYYWLGQYYWVKGDVQEAKVWWNTLVTEHNKVIQGQRIGASSGLYKSPWADKAQKVLKTLQ